MNVLIIGSGGREHGFFTKVKKNPSVKKVLIVGENGAIENSNKILDVDALDFNSVYNLIQDNAIDLVIVGPEVYLEAGIVDYLRAHGVRTIGPSKYCAKLESSKNFAKEMMAKAEIPTANYQYVTTTSVGNEVVAKFGLPVVLKFDGLAAGKGVMVCQSQSEVDDYFEQVFESKCFGAGGVVIEECLVGEEYSVFAYVNGTNYSILPVAQDYKRAHDQDLGPNTGGMGANTTSKYDSQLPFIEECILKPLLNQFIADGYKYTGFLYIGLMQTVDGPKVIEFNVRMGDPETQIVLQKLNSDLIEIFDVVDSGINFEPVLNPNEYVGVVIASEGYPSGHKKNVILNLNQIMRPVYHMGTTIKDGMLVSNGGRVVMVTSQGATVEDARSDVYQQLSGLKLDGFFYRTDIGLGRI